MRGVGLIVLASTLREFHLLRLIPSNTPHPSWRFAPIHLLPQGEKEKGFYFALENASQSPPLIKKPPLMRESSFTRRADSALPARPATMA